MSHQSTTNAVITSQIKQGYKSIKKTECVCCMMLETNHVMFLQFRKGVRESPRVEGAGFHRYRLQSDVFLAINSVQPDKVQKY